MEDLVGIVLAAGLSRRMGRPKQLLPWNGRTLVQHVANQASLHLTKVLVVVGHQRAAIEASLEGCSVECVFNPAYEEGMLSSIRAGIAAAGPVGAYVLFLGDQPNIGAAAIEAVIDGWRRSGKGLVIPTHQGKRGHPVLLAARYRAAIEALPTGQGLNVVTRGYPSDTLEIEVGQEGVLMDLDTPEDYRRASKGLASQDPNPTPPSGGQ